METINLVISGHVDHGKSTLLGRLYADTGTLPEGHLERVRSICTEQGKVFEYAFLFDAFLEEQQQGITIDLARTFFLWKGRRFTILDAPGHREFLKNMVTGAARADAALLVIDAGEGVQAQSRRHGTLLGLLGIRQVAVVINKMDSVNFDPERFRAIEEEIRHFLRGRGIVPTCVVPASAREGDNVVVPSPRLSWFHGPTVLGCFDGFSRSPVRTDFPLRMPVQDVYKFDSRRILAGRVETGRLQAGDRLVFSPSGKTAVVKSIESFPESSSLEEVHAGQSTGCTLDEQIFVERGEIASLRETPPSVTDRFRATIFWMGDGPMKPGRTYGLRLTTQETEVSLETIHRTVNADSLEANEKVQHVKRHEVAEITLHSRSLLALDLFRECEVTGRFVLVDGYDIRGGGIVTGILESRPHRSQEETCLHVPQRHPGRVQFEERIHRNGHRPALLLFTGPSEQEKVHLAGILERRLFENGKQVLLLDEQNLPNTLGRDARLFRAVAGILLCSGSLVLRIEQDLSREDPPRIREQFHPHPVLFIHIGSAQHGGEGPDLFLEPGGDLQEAAETILALMKENGIIS